MGGPASRFHEDDGTPVTRQMLEAQSEALMEHMDASKRELEDLIKSGFPEGDPTSHRKVHEKYIKDAEDRAEFYKNLKESTVKGIVWCLVLFIGNAIWHYIQNEVRK